MDHYDCNPTDESFHQYYTDVLQTHVASYPRDHVPIAELMKHFDHPDDYIMMEEYVELQISIACGNRHQYHEIDIACIMDWHASKKRAYHALQSKEEDLEKSLVNSQNAFEEISPLSAYCSASPLESDEKSYASGSETAEEVADPHHLGEFVIFCDESLETRKLDSKPVDQQDHLVQHLTEVTHNPSTLHYAMVFRYDITDKVRSYVSGSYRFEPKTWDKEPAHIIKNRVKHRSRATRKVRINWPSKPAFIAAAHAEPRAPMQGRKPKDKALELLINLVRILTVFNHEPDGQDRTFELNVTKAGVRSSVPMSNELTRPPE